LGVRDFFGVELQAPKPVKLEGQAHLSWRAPDDAGTPRTDSQDSNSSE
jgi:hypothetical protein